MILHVDMDAFFASVEVLDNPELKGKCMIVGGRSKRGVVAAASYEARKYGIHSAMPVFQARQKNKDLIIVRPRRRRYAEISKKIMMVLHSISPLVEPVSIDEAYVDISGCQRLFGTPVEIADIVKQRIKNTVHLSCSVGIAPNKFLAKIASDIEKPDGLTVILPHEVLQFIKHLPIKKVPGVGRKTKQILMDMGVAVLGDIHKYPEKILLRKIGKYGLRLRSLSNGIDDSKVIPHTISKSVSTEETLSFNTRDKAYLKILLLKHSEDVARQLRRIRMKAKTITLKIKHADFTQVTRNITLKTPTQSSKMITRKSRRLLAAYGSTQKIRLIGVGVSGLVPADKPVQMALFNESNEETDNWRKVDAAIDAIAEKYGKNMIQKASLKNGPRKKKGKFFNEK